MTRPVSRSERRHRGRISLAVAFRESEAGAAMVEFAILVPFLIFLYLGGYVLADNIARSRKVTVTTRALADLVAQSATGTTSAAEVDSELAAATAVMTPFAIAPASLRITEVYTDNNWNTTVQWSRALQGTPYVAGSPFMLSSSLKVPGTYLLLSEVSYAYKPPFTYSIIQPRTLRDQLIMLPRNSSSISCGDC